ncbi:MAG: hypothetical protein IJT87_10855 [Ruminiclostridium sp.]|nr:hypothetical protein [Ruminiclostridium sp.]
MRTETIHMYTKAIIMLQKENDTVRGSDPAKHLCYSKPIVSSALKRLSELGYIGAVRAIPRKWRRQSRRARESKR